MAIPNSPTSAIETPRVPPTVAIERLVNASAIRPRSACEDDSDACLSDRLVAAERDLAAAYDDARGAGVRPRELRDYRNLWVRARGAAVSRPAYALRQYQMITADLDTLTDDATPRAGSSNE